MQMNFLFVVVVVACNTVVGIVELLSGLLLRLLGSVRIFNTQESFSAQMQEESVILFNVAFFPPR